MDDFHSLLLPPRVQRNARGLRADSVQSSSGYRDNATLHHGQVTLLPPPNMVRVRARASDSASLPPVLNSASSSRGVLGDVPEQQEPGGLAAAGAAEPNIVRPAARRKKRRPVEGGGVSVPSSSRAGGSGGGAGLTAAAAYARDISREHARAARAEARAEERRRAVEATVRQQQERAAADLSSVRAEHPATERLRTQQARVGSALGRGASMRRRNVQIDLVHPGEPVDNSDITPPIPPPSYLDSIAVSSTSRRVPAEPPPPTAVAHASHFRPQPQEGSLSRAGSISGLPIPGAFPSSSSIYSSARPLRLDLQTCHARSLSTGPLSPPPPPFDSLSPRTTLFRTVPVPISPPPAFSSLPPLEEPPPNPSGLSRPPPVSVEDERSLLVRQAWESLARLGLTFEERVHRMEQVDETLPRLAGPELDSSDDEEEEDLPMVSARTSLGERPGSFGLALVTGERRPSLLVTAQTTAEDAADGSDSSATPLASSSSSEAPSSTTSSPLLTAESRLSPLQAVEVPPPSRPASAPAPVLTASPPLVTISLSKLESAGPAGTVRPLYSPPPQLAALPWQMDEFVPISLRLASVPDTHPPQTSEMVDEDNSVKQNEEVQAKEAVVDQASGASESEQTSASAVPSLPSSDVGTAIDAVASTALSPAQPVLAARTAAPSSSPVAAVADSPPATVLPPSLLRRGRPSSLEINKQSRLMLDGLSSGDSTPQLQTDSAQPTSLSAPTVAAAPSSGVVHGGPPSAPPVNSSSLAARPPALPQTHSALSQLVTPASALRRPPPPVPPRPAFLRFPVDSQYGTHVVSPPTSPRSAQSRSSTSTPPSSYKPPPAPESPPPLAPQRGFMPLPPPPAPPSSPLTGSPLRSPLVIQQIAPLSPSPLSQDPISAAPTPPPLPPRPRHLRSFGQPSPVEPSLLLSPPAPLPAELIAAPPPILARPQPPFLSESLRGLSNISTSSSIFAEQHQPHGMPTHRPLQETWRRSLEKPGGSSSASQDPFSGSQLRPAPPPPPAPTATAATATTAAAGKSERPWAVRPLPPIPMGLRVLPAAGPRPAVDRSASAFSPASPPPPPAVVSAPAMRAPPPHPPAPRRPPPPPPPPPSAAAASTRPPPSRGVSSSSSADSLDRASATASTRPVSDRVDSLVLSSRNGGEREYTDLDLLVLRLDQADADQYEAATTIQSFLGPARPPGLSFSEFEALPRGEVVEVSRRTTREGKTKIKLSCPALDQRRVDRCSFGCLTLFRDGDVIVGLMVGENGGPGCGHLGHEECARKVFEQGRRCPVCRTEAVPLP